MGNATLTSPIVRILLGSVAPGVLFHKVSNAGEPLTGAVVAGLLSLVVLAFMFVKLRRIDVFGLIGAVFVVFELAALWVSRSAQWYFYAPIISTGCLCAVFFISLFWKRPLIQILAEEMEGEDTFPDALQASPLYRKAWLQVTAMWGGAYFIKGALLLTLLLSMSQEFFVTAKSTLGWVLFIGMMSFSYWYPRRYWEKHFTTQSTEAGEAS